MFVISRQSHGYALDLREQLRQGLLIHRHCLMPGAFRVFRFAGTVGQSSTSGILSAGQSGAPSLLDLALHYPSACVNCPCASIHDEDPRADRVDDPVVPCIMDSGTLAEKRRSRTALVWSSRGTATTNAIRPAGEDGRLFKRVVRLTDTSTSIWVRTRPFGRSESGRILTPGEWGHLHSDPGGNEPGVVRVPEHMTRTAYRKASRHPTLDCDPPERRVSPRSAGRHTFPAKG